MFNCAYLNSQARWYVTDVHASCEISDMMMAARVDGIGRRTYRVT